MVRLTRIYTKGGDKGNTSLGTKKRVPKTCLRIAALGDVDEANAALGVVRAFCTEDKINTLLARLQNDLFDVGADLCTPEDGAPKPRLQDSQVAFLEESIEGYNHSLPPLTSFVLPGGTPLSALLHQARTLVRRAERSCWALHEKESLNPFLLQYLNRLSDLLFVLARSLNHKGEKDILWIPTKA